MFDATCLSGQPTSNVPSPRISQDHHPPTTNRHSCHNVLFVPHVIESRQNDLPSACSSVTLRGLGLSRMQVDLGGGHRDTRFGLVVDDWVGTGNRRDAPLLPDLHTRVLRNGAISCHFYRVKLPGSVHGPMATTCEVACMEKSLLPVRFNVRHRVLSLDFRNWHVIAPGRLIIRQLNLRSLNRPYKRHGIPATDCSTLAEL